MKTTLRTSGLSRRTAGCAGPAVALTPKQLALVAELGARMSDGSVALVDEPCVCGAEPRDVAIAQVDRYGLPMQSVLCLSCGTVRANPYLDEFSLQSFYRDHYQELYGRSHDESQYFANQHSYGERVMRAIRALVPHAKAVVEVGCGAGGALRVLEKEGIRVAGCDHSERLIQFGRSQGLSGLVAGDLSALRAEHPNGWATDVLFLHHVFEHLSDPLRFLESCKHVLASSGVVLLIVPDISRIDAYPFPGGDIRLFLHMAHKFNYSRQGLRELAHRAGFSIEFIDGFDSAVAPELWALLRPRDEFSDSVPSGETGPDMLRYLRRTELKYRLGLLPGLHRSRLKRLAAAVLPAFAKHALQRAWHKKGRAGRVA